MREGDEEGIEMVERHEDDEKNDVDEWESVSPAETHKEEVKEEEEVDELGEAENVGSSVILTFLIYYFGDDSVFVNIVKASLYASQSPNFLLFLAISFLMSASFAILSTYAFLFFEQELDASPSLLGLCVLSSVMAEVPFFYFSGAIIDSFGLEWTVGLSLLLMSVRCGGYVVIHHAYLAPILELLHGVIFGALYSSAMAYVDRHSPPALKISSQGLYKSVSHGAGGLTGNIIGGHVYHQYGPRCLFAGLSAVIFLSFVMWVAVHYIRRSHPVTDRS